MKILFAPYNIASMPALTAEALNSLGHEAICLNFGIHKYKESNIYVVNIECDQTSNNWFYLLYCKLKYLIALYKLLKWCDVVHWTWRGIFPFNLDIKLVKKFGKIRFIEWVGSDIRIPEITKIESPWYWTAYNNGYEYKDIESYRKSYKTQKIFSSLGFIPILTPEMHLFLIDGMFQKIYPVFYRCFSKEKFNLNEPIETDSSLIRILHSPSAKFAKGSNYIIEVVEELKNIYPIDFLLLNNVSRETVLEEMQKCDIFIDQIILGSYAAAAIEAMAFSKPVVAFIMTRVYENGIPVSCPIVNANPLNLKEKLIELIVDRNKRLLIGNKSRSYVEEFHDVYKESKKLLNIYKEISYRD